jgi:multidrug transporter EmrE-like cation transporter
MMAGQMMFKLAAGGYASEAGTTLVGRALSLVANPFFVASLILYFLLSVFWVWILTFTPISKAYPFVAVSFVGTALGGWLFFGEKLSAVNVFGLVLLAAGIVLATR